MSGTAAPRPFVLASERLGPADVDVVRFRGEEAISEGFEYAVEIVSPLPYAALEEALFGQQARLIMEAPAGPRAVTGIVRTIAAQGARDTPGGRRTAASLQIVPRLSLLANQRSSRIFQNKNVAEIVAQILGAWGIPHRFALVEPHESWEYCVQHQESDDAFLRRLLSAEGVYFFFVSPAGAGVGEEVVVFADAPAGHEAPLERWLGDGAARSPAEVAEVPRLRVAVDGALVSEAEQLVRWTRSRAMAPGSVRLRDYAPNRALHDLATRAGVPAGAEGASIGRVYTYLPARPLTGSTLGDEATTRRALEQARARAVRYEGAGDCRRLAAGQRFFVEATGEHGLDGEHVVVRLTCEGRTPELVHDAGFVYQTSFEAIGAGDPLRPPPAPPRPAPPLDTAVVTGPPGAETHTDALGRVQVRFRWDLDNPEAATSSCWLRVAQGWSGAGYGVHFLPRVGMEVLVGYLGGDIDRPVVLGCVPNSATPGPFPLPAEAAQSGIVTRSMNGGAGSSLVFDDTAESERIVVSAQRDMETVVRNEQRTEVAGRQAIAVGKERVLAVKGRRVDEIAAEDRLTVGGDRRVDVAGEHALRVAGPASGDYQAGLGVNVKGEAALHVDGEAAAQVNGPLRLDVEDDAVVRGAGHAVLLVGSHAAARSLLVHVEGTSSYESTKTLEISSDQSIVLRCGDSSIVITPSSIQLVSAKVRIDADTLESAGDTVNVKAGKLARIEGKKAFLLSDGASVCLTANAKVNGGKVQLGSPPDGSDGPEARATPPPPTKLKLADQDGNPLPGERYVLVLGDGSERGGVLDANGEAILPGLEGAAKIRFPDLPSWKGG
ncbi:MAG: type VI secretion system tip protein TssI/VgrG [Minicystis sp.]